MRLRRIDEQFELLLTEGELDAIHSGLAETLQALEDWEFHTRTGMQRAEMKAVLQELLEARRALKDGGLQSDG